MKMNTTDFDALVLGLREAIDSQGGVPSVLQAMAHRNTTQTLWACFWLAVDRNLIPWFNSFEYNDSHIETGLKRAGRIVGIII
jgi:hypothetical protein